MVDALKRGSAKRITVVLPFYPYARQDKKHRGREPISARLVADLLKTAGANRILTVDLHTAQIQGFFDGPVDHLFAMDILAEYVEQKYAGRPMTVVAPDSGRVRVAERWTDRLGGCPLAFIHKTRDPLKPNQVVANRVVGDVEGRVCLIVDDMIDTGWHHRKAAEILYDAGAADVIVAATHALLSDPATERLKNSRISEVVVTNTLPLPPEKRLDKITVLSIAPLLARAIREVFDDGSVTTLFGGLSSDLRRPGWSSRLLGRAGWSSLRSSGSGCVLRSSAAVPRRTARRRRPPRGASTAAGAQRPALRPWADLAPLGRTAAAGARAGPPVRSRNVSVSWPIPAPGRANLRRVCPTRGSS